ncbi:MAG: hypothetical protein KDJ38_16615, partial [Gammaproteobacteria bacterium]|nr:hypothetical protein [Gammaproteobacteria bacterium]
RPLSGLAIAATVAAVSILGLRYLQPVDPVAPQLASSGNAGQALETGAPILPATTVQPSAGDVRLVDNTGTYWMVGKQRVSDAGMEERLNRLLSDHTEFATVRSVGSMLPYSRIVGYDEVRK